MRYRSRSSEWEFLGNGFGEAIPTLRLQGIFLLEASQRAGMLGKPLMPGQLLRHVSFETVGWMC